MGVKSDSTSSTTKKRKSGVVRKSVKAASSASATQPRLGSVKIMDRPSELNLAPVVAFLQNALDMKTKGDSLHYRRLVDQLTSRDDIETRWRLYLGLAQCVTSICEHPEEYRDLIHTLFRFDWDFPAKVTAAFSSLILQLISANTTYLVPAMHMLVRALVLRPGEYGATDGAGAAATRQQLVHTALRSLLTLAPSGCSKLFPVLAELYPHKRYAAEVLADYAKQVLLITTYVPMVQDRVLRLAIEKCLEIDVEIKITDKGEAVREEENEEEDVMFDLDDLHVDEGTGPGAASKKGREKVEEVDEMAEKLDGLMLVLFTYIGEQVAACQPNTTLTSPPEHGQNGSVVPGDGALRVIDASRLNEQQSTDEGSGMDTKANGMVHTSSSSNIVATTDINGPAAGEVVVVGGLENQEAALRRVKRLFEFMLDVFEKSILNTHRSKFVQYVLFYMCGQVPVLADMFVERLRQLVLDDDRHLITRQCSVAYLASFLSRAAFVSEDTVLEGVRGIMGWVHLYLDRYEADGEADVKSFAFGASASPRVGSASPASLSRRWSGSGSGSGILGEARLSGDDGGGGGSGGVGNGGGSRRLRKGEGDVSHKLFYSFCQAAFYVTCFRSRLLAPHIKHNSRSWVRVLGSSLNPLKHCLESVRREFSRLCRVLIPAGGLPPDVATRLLLGSQPTVKAGAAAGPAGIVIGASLSGGEGGALAFGQLSKTGGMGRGENPLDSFFPFDPYLLRHSHVFVANMYVYWTGGALDEEEEEEDSDEEEEREGGAGEGGEDDDSDDEDDGRSDAASSHRMLASSVLSENLSVMSVSPCRPGMSVGSELGHHSLLITQQQYHGHVGSVHASRRTTSWGTAMDGDFHEAVSPGTSPTPPVYGNGVSTPHTGGHLGGSAGIVGADDDNDDDDDDSDDESDDGQAGQSGMAANDGELFDSW